MALGRYAGLRVPSELRGLCWADIQWDRDRFTVHSPKTEAHRDGGIRSVPIFAELLPFLRDAFELAEPGAEFVIGNATHRNASNLSTQLNRIIRRAGRKTWPKPWHNMRASRQTELAAEHPMHAVNAWIGNSAAVAQEHYLQVRDSDYTRAAVGPEAVQKPQQKPQQYTSASSGTEKHPATTRTAQASVASEETALTGQEAKNPPAGASGSKWAREDSNLQPSVPKTGALSN